MAKKRKRQLILTAISHQEALGFNKGTRPQQTTSDKEGDASVTIRIRS